MDLYRERLWATPWLFVSTILVVPAVMLVFAPINFAVGVVLAIVFYAAIVIALPEGYLGFVVPRSGLAMRHGITIVNAPGTVDAGYRGEIKVTVLNTDRSMSYDIAVGDRIAQLIVMPVTRARFIPVDSLPDSHRGTAGFGSSGYTVTQSGDHA